MLPPSWGTSRGRGLTSRDSEGRKARKAMGRGQARVDLSLAELLRGFSLATLLEASATGAPRPPKGWQQCG